MQYVDATEVYYRLKIVTATGQFKYSSVVVVRLSNKQNYQFTVHPNPAKNLVKASFVSESKSIATIRLMDNLGKTILIQKEEVVKGNNSISITGLQKYANAVYTLQIILPDEVLTQKLIIHNH